MKRATKARRISMHAFDVLGDPVRRRILEILATGEQPAGAVAKQMEREFGISQAGVSQHLSVLRRNGFAGVRADGSRRIYSVDTTSFQVVDSWLDQFRSFWGERLNALTAEIARGKRERRKFKPSSPKAMPPQSNTL
jgi:DNA-binding transcriptional ArsR family regulator